MKKHLLLLLLAVVCHTVSAQSSGKFAIKAVVLDTADQKMPFATTMLLLPKDSSLVTYGRTNDNGILEFKNVKRGKYLLKVNYVGYLPYQQEIASGEGDVLDLGKIQMKILNQDLYEVVIKTARAPLSIRGDTVEYNASSFKVPPGSSVEDLLKKLPGVEVDPDGNIKAQGDDVKRVTVDGKRFFGDDPKMATKNLPAEAINKVQIINGKTEQAKLTGVDDGKREKTVNLELKDSHKKGGFGKATIGAGTDSRVSGKASYNKFDTKQQFSVVGFGNNLNETGLSRDDYQDFKGSQAFKWGNDGDFGFEIGKSRFDDGIKLDYSWGGGTQGFTKNFAGGGNYNYDNKKSEVNASYFYSQTDMRADMNSFQENFLVGNSYRSEGRNSTKSFTGNHRPSFRFETDIDSLKTLTFISNARINNGDNDNQSTQNYFRSGGVLSNSSKVMNNSYYDSFAMSNLLLYKQKFKKKGRSFGASIGYNFNNSDGTGNQQSVNEFFLDSTRNSVIHQFNDTKSLRGELKGSLLYVEPFGKKVSLETFYNYSLRNDKVDREVFDIQENDSRVQNDFLTRYYTNDFTYNRLGTSLRYSNKGFSVSGGLAGQQIDLDGRFRRNANSSEVSRVDRRFFNLVPNAHLSYYTKNNRSIYLNYSQRIQEPSISDLQPFVDNSNPLYIVEGNPDLAPSLTHTLNGNFQIFNPATFVSFFSGLSYSYNIDQVVRNKTIDENLVTTVKPVNMSGGKGLNSYFYLSFPLKKTVAALVLNGGYNLTNNPIFINNLINKTTSNSFNFSLRLDYTPNEVITFYPYANWNFTNTKYSISTSENQNFNRSNYGADMNIKMPKDFYFNMRFTQANNVNKLYNIDTKQPILNLAIYKIFLKSKKAEIRLAANDVFKKNLGITQFADANFFSETRVSTLSRYFMLSFTYNLRGVSANIKRKEFF